MVPLVLLAVFLVAAGLNALLLATFCRASQHVALRRYRLRRRHVRHAKRQRAWMRAYGFVDDYQGYYTTSNN